MDEGAESGVDLMDEVLTLDGLHDIDAEIDTKKEFHVEPSGGQQVDSAMFEQLLWQPAVDGETEATVDDTTIKQETVLKTETSIDESLLMEGIELTPADISIDETTKKSISDEKLRLSLTIDEQDYDIRSEAGGSSDADGGDDKHSKHRTAAAAAAAAAGGGGGVGDVKVAAAIKTEHAGSVVKPLDTTESVFVEPFIGGGGDDDSTRKRRHSQISPIKWTAFDSDAPPGVGELKKPKPEKSEAEIERDSKLKYIFRSARFFIIKSNNYENVALSKARGIWSTMPQNEARLNQAFRQCCNVILIFSIRESGKFQGYARLASESDKMHPPVRWVLPPRLDPQILSGVFKLDWINRRDLSFTDCSHLKNPWNEGKPVKVGRDGQEIEPTVGEALCRLFAPDENIDLRRIAQIARQSLKRREGGGSSIGKTTSITGTSSSSSTVIRSLSDTGGAAASAAESSSRSDMLARRTIFSGETGLAPAGVRWSVCGARLWRVAGRTNARYERHICCSVEHCLPPALCLRTIITALSRNTICRVWTAVDGAQLIVGKTLAARTLIMLSDAAAAA